MTNTIQIMAGSRFLPGRSIDDLQDMHKRERNPKAATLLLVCIMRKKGMSIRQIAAAHNRSYSTIRSWLARINEGGIGRRHDIKRPGGRPRMSPAQLKGLRADLIAGPQQCGFGSGLWTAPLLVTHIKRKYGIRYAPSGIYHMLHRMGFPGRRPRPKHPKSASKSQANEFKKKLAR